jgi:hypothetical protein
MFPDEGIASVEGIADPLDDGSGHSYSSDSREEIVPS